MPATIVGDSSVKFGLEGATGPSMGIVESVSYSNSYASTSEVKDSDGLYDSGAVNMRGKVTQITINGVANDSVTFIKPGDSLSFTKPSGITGTYPSSLYVTSMELTGSAGEFNKVTITGYGAASLA
jgi:hypothetical protein